LFLDRYTTLPNLLSILTSGQIALRNPEFWDDRNDAHYLARYKEEKGLKTLLALCFTTHAPSYLRWKTYTQSCNGVCIRFNKAQLIEEVNNRPGFKHKPAIYKTVEELETDPPPVNEWAFLKRKMYQAEGEYRILFESPATEPDQTLSNVLPCIQRITLSPWLTNEEEAENVIAAIRLIGGCDSIKIIKSGIIQSARWRAAIQNDGPKKKA